MNDKEKRLIRILYPTLLCALTHLFKSSPLEVKQGCLVLFMEILARKFASLPLGTRHCRGGRGRRCSADTGAGGNRHEDRRSKVRIGGVERGAVIKSD